MKRVILSALVVSSLLATSCKKAKEAGKDLKETTEEIVNDAAETTKNAVDKTVDATKNVVEDVEEAVENATNTGDAKIDEAIAVAKEMGIEIPNFKNIELTKNLADYAMYAKDYLAAKGNVTTIAKLAPKGKELLTKGKELLNNVDSETVKKYTSVLTAIQSKMAPSN